MMESGVLQICPGAGLLRLAQHSKEQVNYQHIENASSERDESMPTYIRGDYIKAEFRNDQTGESEWMWVRIDSCDDEKKVVFGELDSVPVLDHEGKLGLGSQLAVSYDNIREYRKAAEFEVQ